MRDACKRRKIRRVRVCLFLFALPLAVVLTACGGSHRAATRSRSTVPRTELGLKACSLNLFFAAKATHGQEQAVGAQLRQDARVKQVVFTSKAQALAEFKKRNPGIAKALPLHKNPLPDSFGVVPAKLANLLPIQRSLAHRPGVATLKLVPCRPPER